MPSNHSEHPHKFLKNPRVAAVIPCPFSGGQPRAGVDHGPSHLIQDGLIKSIESVGYSTALDELNLSTVLKQDDPDIGILKNPRLVAETNKSLMNTINSHTEKGEFIVTIGGDHSLAIGTLSGTLNAFPEACVIWVDAHADINTPDTTETGNLHGCPVSFLLSTLHAGKDLEPFEWIQPCLKPDRLVYIGLRDIDMGERKILKEHNIRCFTMHDVDKHGIGKVVEMALESVNKDLTRPIHLSFDVDALDPSVAPSTGTPVRGGLTFREGHYICEAIYETGCLVALDLMEVNPTLMTTEADVIQTLSVGQSLIRSAMGESLI
ncbi:Arginase, catabolizes arginine to ornithine and urea [Puccinia graminis f. sp. tritici]|uniref:Arginase n=2 Tax=Puccinia graminis f. sp. tritici TaxID=56615 RepID=E3L0V2_PUCGT|nr:arginase [Puccinia graminis f. sp. tritici CRL 75-36-700-3]EFP90177.1 arginase [Puccinia graminis f. sp. tritici CRL 75-36-700-3]KAA1126437.1 Arginase, catabolizes arginine to ornithine and urea [Puccinia graminis f. sp. tritici]